METVFGNCEEVGEMTNGTPAFDAYYMTFEICLWFASTFGVERLRTYVAQAKRDVAQHDADVTLALEQVRNLAKKTRVYRIGRNPTSEDVLSLSFLIGDDDELEDFLTSDDSLEDNVAVRQYQRLLQDFLISGGLSSREREVFIRQTGLLGVKQYLSKEIAVNLGISRQTVEVSGRRAIAKCKAFLEERGFSVEDLR